MTVIAELKNVSIGYGRKLIVKNVDLKLSAGEFWSLIGRNGAGKSTLMGAFNGLTPVISGEVFFKGERVTKANLRGVRSRIAHVFQMIDVDPRLPMTVFETVLAGTYGRLGLFRRVQKEEIDLTWHALEQVGLTDLADYPLGCVSGGQRQRAAIARALVQKPELMLLDEPTAALDWQAQRDILHLIRDLQEKLNITVLMATHDLNAVSHITTHTAMLQSGTLVWAGKTDEGMTAENLSRLYGTEVDVFEHNGRRVALF